MSSIQADIPLVLAALGALLAVTGLMLVVLSGRRRTRVFEADVDSLRDEVWELREAAAARDRAEAANEAKSRFLASVTHEVRTPLNGILGMADLLSATALNPEQQTYVSAIRSSGSALASLIDEILDFSKIEAGKVELAEERFDLVALVEGVTELLAPRAQGKGLEIASTVAVDVPRKVIGDPVRLRQILLNLAGNAVKFTETGGVGLRVSREDGLVRLDVIDTGPGVPDDRRDAIFEDFEQAGTSRLLESGGTGLGLAISKRLAERMGGTLELAASSAAGAQFTIRLPLTPADESDTDPLVVDGLRALFVAPSPFEVPFLAARLGAAGAHACHAATADEGLARLAGGTKFDLVFVDCAFGEGAVHLLSDAARRAGVARTVVLFSPFERRAFGQASARGFDGWLVKPVRSRSLVSLLASGCETQSSHVPSPSSSGSAINVLLAEDNEINALLATRHLQRLGASVTHAPDGLAALASVEAALDAGTPYEAVVLDIRMPGLDGIELARRIRLAEAARHAGPSRLIALSADLADTGRHPASLVGIDECLGKPLNFSRLQQALGGIAPSRLREDCR